jgi:glycine betaine catabolism A
MGGPARSQAPLRAEDLEASLRPFGHSRLLPRAAYVDADVFSWEQSAFFGGGWTCVGWSEDVAEPGDQRAVALGTSTVFLARGEGGTLRGFANVCRHRGHELLPCGEARHLPFVVCPYHSWSYRLDGSLRSAPRFDAWAWFEPEDNGLVELPTHEWMGWVFVNGSGDAGPLRRHLHGLEPFVAPYEPDRLVRAAQHDYTVEANWKVLVENYQECYHCGMIHPELCMVSPPRSGANYQLAEAGAWVGGWKALRDDARTMSLSGDGEGTVLRGLSGRAVREVAYLAVFPNLLVSLHPDYVMTHLLTPLGPGRTHVRCRWAFSPEDVGRPGFDPSYAVDFWDLTNRQDWAACQSVQRGLGSEHWVPGVLGPDEDGVYQFVTMVARGYQGLPLAAGTVPVA